MASFKEVMGTVGSSITKAGKFIGQKTAEGYKTIDPDVMRHLAQLPLLSYSLLVSRREKIDPQKPDGYRPLIFVHGLGGNRGNFLLMSWYLHLMGRKRSYKIHFEPGQTVDDMARALTQFIEDVKKVTGEEKVDIIAHSLGGLVARLAMNEFDADKSISTLVTLGTPHMGTYPARYANTSITRDLRPESDLIMRVNEKPWPEDVNGITFFSRNDLFVLPADSAKVEGTKQIDMTPFTHYSYLLDPKSWSTVGKFMADETKAEIAGS